MNKTLKLALVSALFGQLSLIALETNQNPAVNPASAALQKEVDTAKRTGQLTGIAAEARALETRKLLERYSELASKSDKTTAEQEELKTLTEELKAHLGNTFRQVINKR